MPNSNSLTTTYNILVTGSNGQVGREIKELSSKYPYKFCFTDRSNIDITSKDDIRKNSPTFGKYVAVELSGENKKQLLIPRGFAHGFVVLEDDTVFAYKVDNYYSPECDRGIVFDDKNLNIDWILNHDELNLSAKDTKQPNLNETNDLFEFGVNYYA